MMARAALSCLREAAHQDSAVHGHRGRGGPDIAGYDGGQLCAVVDFYSKRADV